MNKTSESQLTQQRQLRTAARLEIGIDTGGTYTDAVLYDRDQGKILGWAKALTTREDLSRGIGEALDGLPTEARHAQRVALSTTLATNACIEGKGGRAKLVLLGMHPGTVNEVGREYGLPPLKDIWMLDSLGTMGGDILREPDWDAFLRESEAWFADAEAVAVVEVFAMWNNAALEKKARQVIASRHDIPIVCGHDLFNDLNSLQRAASALLNARLLPLIQDFLRATRRALAARGIGCPLVIVRSDGTLMSEGMTTVRPVETLLCGPAASVMGAMALAQEPDCVILDMGGTTTDVAMVQGGVARRSGDGITIGPWRTFVRGVFIDTYGLGGDTEIRPDGHGGLTLCDGRVIPLCVLASQHPQVVAVLRELADSIKHHTQPLHGFYVLVKDIGENAGYTDDERAFCAALRSGPLSLQQAAAAVGSDVYNLRVDRLEREGVVLRAGLTPTDVMHLKGDFHRFDAEASRLAVEFLSNCLETTPEDVCTRVYDAVEHRMYRNIVRVLLQDSYPAYRKGLGEGLERLIDLSWRAAKEGFPGFARVSFATPAALVGVGAPIHVFLPAVAAALGARCVVAPDAPVANALGAVVGNVSAVCTVEVRADYDVIGITGYTVYGYDSTPHTETLEEALALAEADASQAAQREARLRGATGELEVTVHSGLQQGHAKESGFLLGAVVTATASGRISD